MIKKIVFFKPGVVMTTFYWRRELYGTFLKILFPKEAFKVLFAIG
ncbi:MAG: hypothetical protein ACFB0B_11200 [Thermonemataceae bacterium]